MADDFGCFFWEVMRTSPAPLVSAGHINIFMTTFMVCHNPVLIYVCLIASPMAMSTIASAQFVHFTDCTQETKIRRNFYY